ncbi:MAG TPA: HU family DNA-binding protein [Polyangia bacterium]|jgi:nucleoid DNA-binding protein|nr:HU family DNA-binding protein [Polyangia bacterium]
MTKAELIERVHAKKHIPRHLTKKAVAQIVDAVFLEMGDYFIRTKVTRNATAKLTYPGFGTFLKRRRGERTVKNPQNGDPIVIPPQSTITFSPGQELRSLLNRNGKNGAKDRDPEPHQKNGHRNGEALDKNGQAPVVKNAAKSGAK